MYNKFLQLFSRLENYIYEVILRWNLYITIFTIICLQLFVIIVSLTSMTLEHCFKIIL